MRLWELIDAWISRAWNAGLRSDAPRQPTVPAHTAHREHEAHLHDIVDRTRRRSHVPSTKPVAMTGTARKLLRDGHAMAELEDEITEPIGRPHGRN